MITKPRGTTLIEVLISAAILSVITVCIFSLQWSSKAGISRADEHREARYLSDLLMRCAENSDFVVLYKTFGTPFPDCPECLQGGDNDNSPGVMRGGKNVLSVDDWVLDRLGQKGWTVDLKFRFLTKQELAYRKPKDIKPESGVLHFQAGVIWLRLLAGRRVMEEIKKCVYCPMILGRPGLALNQCPAVNPQVRDQPPLNKYP